jgi:DNA-binding NarL/FixJ family response regulator
VIEVLSATLTVCAGSPIPFDATEVDRKLAAAHTLDALATTVTRVVFDLYDHCALVVRFFLVEDSGEPRLLNVDGDRRLASSRRAQRSLAISTGKAHSATLSHPAGFRLVAAPLHEGDAVIGLIEFIVPTELVKPKHDRLALVARAASSALRAWRSATDAQHEARLATGTSFALGLRLASALTKAGELGVATRDGVELLARELHAPVAAWRIEPSGEAMHLSSSSGLASRHRSALATCEVGMSASRDRKEILRDLRSRVGQVLGSDATLVDGGPVVFVAGGRHPELDLCGHELAALLERLPASGMTVVDEDDCSWSMGALERARLKELTSREREILGLLASGANTRQIAGHLVISEKTVKTHVQNILRKLDVTSRLEAASVAMRAGYVPLPAS